MRLTHDGIDTASTAYTLVTGDLGNVKNNQGGKDIIGADIIREPLCHEVVQQDILSETCW